MPQITDSTVNITINADTSLYKIIEELANEIKLLKTKVQELTQPKYGDYSITIKKNEDGKYYAGGLGLGVDAPKAPSQFIVDADRVYLNKAFIADGTIRGIDDAWKLTKNKLTAINDN